MHNSKRQYAECEIENKNLTIRSFDTRDADIWGQRYWAVIGFMVKANISC